MFKLFLFFTTIMLTISCSSPKKNYQYNRNVSSKKILPGSKLEFNSAIFSGSISDKFKSLKPYIILSDNSDEIGLLTCDDRSRMLFAKNKVHVTLRDREMNKIQDKRDTAIIDMNYEDCKKLMERLISGEITIILEYGNETKYSINNMTSYIKDSFIKEISN